MHFEVRRSGVRLGDLARKIEDLARTAETEAVATLNAGGTALRKAMVPTLVRQTGLKTATIDRFLHEVPASGGNPIYEMRGGGGNVSLRYFGARETAQGVSAAPWGARRTYAGTFMKAGWWPHRVAKPNWNGQVFRRTGGTTGTGNAEFEKVRSGLYIAIELTRGATLATFEKGAAQIGAVLVRRLSATLP